MPSMGLLKALTVGLQDVDEAFLRGWIRAHVEDAAQLHKPVRPGLAKRMPANHETWKLLVHCV